MSHALSNDEDDTLVPVKHLKHGESTQRCTEAVRAASGAPAP